jgi:hypothetical protein
MGKQRLFMVLTGCRPDGRNTEQHDIFFGIAPSMAELVPALKASWPSVKGKIHIDAWREVTQVDGYSVLIDKRDSAIEPDGSNQLFFINLGGYQHGLFDELHYKMLVAAPSMGKAIQIAKKSDFYKQKSFAGAESHVDDKFGIDVDDATLVAEILPLQMRQTYSIALQPADTVVDDVLHIGYFKIDSFL